MLTQFAFLTEQLLLDPSEKISTSKPDTVRVTNVPDEMTIQQLQKKLTTLFGVVAKVHSLARDRPHREVGQDSSWRKCATVTFPTIINERLKYLVEHSEGSERKLCGEEPCLAYDMKFLGVTPLYDYGDKALVELVHSFSAPLALGGNMMMRRRRYLLTVILIQQHHCC